MNLLSELKRRNVFKVAIAYLMLSWVILQIVDVVSPLIILGRWIYIANVDNPVPHHFDHGMGV